MALDGALGERLLSRVARRFAAGLLDVHIVTDDDIAKKTSYAVKIGAATDPARLLPIGGQSH